MGRYIDDILQPGEKVLYSTNAHWIFYLPAIAAWIVAAGPARPVALDHHRRHRPAVPVGFGRGGARRAVLDRQGLVPSLDHRDRRHQSAGCPQDRLHQAPHLRDEPRQGRERRRQPEHSRPHPQLRRRHHARASARARRPSRPSPRRSTSAITSPRDRSGAPSMTMQQNSRKSFRARRRPRSIPPRSRNFQNCRRNGGIPTARWRRCTRSIRCG